MKIATGERHYDLRDEDGDVPTATVLVSDASEASVLTVLNADPDAVLGFARSQWVWLRFPDGTLALATFPQDDTYSATEADHTTTR